MAFSECSDNDQMDSIEATKWVERYINSLKGKAKESAQESIDQVIDAVADESANEAAEAQGNENVINKITDEDNGSEKEKELFR